MTVLSKMAAAMPRNPTMITPNPTAMRNTDPTRFRPSDSVANSLFSTYSHRPIASEATPKHCKKYHDYKWWLLIYNPCFYSIHCSLLACIIFNALMFTITSDFGCPIIIIIDHATGAMQHTHTSKFHNQHAIVIQYKGAIW